MLNECRVVSKYIFSQFIGWLVSSILLHLIYWLIGLYIITLGILFCFFVYIWCLLLILFFSKYILYHTSYCFISRIKDALLCNFYTLNQLEVISGPTIIIYYHHIHYYHIHVFLKFVCDVLFNWIKVIKQTGMKKIYIKDNDILTLNFDKFFIGPCGKFLKKLKMRWN